MQGFALWTFSNQENCEESAWTTENISSIISCQLEPKSSRKQLVTHWNYTVPTRSPYPKKQNTYTGTAKFSQLTTKVILKINQGLWP